jgi:hypothetical protein
VFKFLAACIAREWKEAVLGEDDKHIAEWNYTFGD